MTKLTKHLRLSCSVVQKKQGKKEGGFRFVSIERARASNALNG